MAYSVVTSLGHGTSITGGTTSDLDTTGANGIVVGVHWYSGNSPSSTLAGALSDSKSNTYLELTKYDSGAAVYQAVKFFYCPSPTVGTGHNWTITPGHNAYPTLTIIALSGAHTSPYDKENGSSSTGASSIQPGSVTPAEDNSILISCATINSTSAKSINSSFTKLLDVTGSSGNYVYGALAYKIQTTLGAENPTWSWSGGEYCAANIAVFKAAAAATATPKNPFGLMFNGPFGGPIG